YSSAVQLMFANEEASREFHFIGTLADALNVDAKWERAVEGVFGSSLQSVVVPTPDDAARAAQWLRENNGGRASFLVAGLHGGSDESSGQAPVQVNALSCSFDDLVCQRAHTRGLEDFGFARRAQRAALGFATHVTRQDQCSTGSQSRRR